MKFLPIVVLAVWINVQVAHSRFYDVGLYTIILISFSYIFKPEHNVERKRRNIMTSPNDVPSTLLQRLFNIIRQFGFGCRQILKF